MNGARVIDRGLSDLFNDLIAHIPKRAKLLDVVVGLHWTAVSIELEGRIQCGLAATVVGEHAHGEDNNVGPAGHLPSMSILDLAALVYSRRPTERAVGLASVNACVNSPQDEWKRASAVKVLASRGRGRNIGLIGHFPFIPELSAIAGELFVIEKEPLPNEYPETQAADILPRCDVVGITSMTLINGSFDQLMNHISPNAFVMLLGPSTPMSPILYKFGVDMLAGTHIEQVRPVMQAVKEGANYRQIHKIGTRLVAMERATSDSG